MEIREISYKDAVSFVVPLHYAGRIPQITVAFGAYVDGVLYAVMTVGKPASNSLCKGILGEEHSHQVYELNRLVALPTFDYPLSQFVGACLRLLKSRDWVLVSYADTGMNHTGYIYQATNWLYTGKTKRRTDKYTEGNKHSRHYNKKTSNVKRKVRHAKHRYVFFCTNSKKTKKEWSSKLNYPVQPYPKEENKRYKLGTYQKPIIIVKDS